MMTLRLLCTILTALALLCMPLAMTGEGAMAMPRTSAETADMAGHCDDMGKLADKDAGAKMKMGCTSACSAIPAAEACAIAPILPQRSTVQALQSRMLAGISPESDIPPPRFS